jgi:acyl-CoA thioester hydrolase
MAGCESAQRIRRSSKSREGRLYRRVATMRPIVQAQHVNVRHAYDEIMSAACSHTIQVRVRYPECDPMGVAHHTAYPVWFEMGRTEMLRAGVQRDGKAFSYRDLEQQGVFLAVVALQVRYKKPARYDDLLDLRTILIDAGHVKIHHEYELYRDSILLATGSTTLACLDRQGRPHPVPEHLATTLASNPVDAPRHAIVSPRT